MSENNYCKLALNVIVKDHGLDAAALVTVKTNKADNTTSIELLADGPNDSAVSKIHEIISTALSESIKAFENERKKAKQEATNAG